MSSLTGFGGLFDSVSGRRVIPLSEIGSASTKQRAGRKQRNPHKSKASKPKHRSAAAKSNNGLAKRRPAKKSAAKSKRRTGIIKKKSKKRAPSKPRRQQLAF